MLKIRQLTYLSDQIVFRLRLAFLCISLTLILAGALGGYQFANLLSSQENAIERAVPSLVTGHELQSELARLLGLKERLRQANTSAALTNLENHIKRLIRSLLDTVEQSVTVPTSALNRIGVGLMELDQLLSDIVPLRLQLIRSQTTLTEQRQRLINHRTQFLYRVEPRLIEAAFLLDEALDQPESLSLPARASIRAQVEVQKSLSELSFRVMAVIDLAEQMSLRTGSQFSTEGAVDLQFRLRSAAQILASLQNDPFRRQLALMLKELHDLILGSEGLVGELEAFEGYEASLERLLSDQGAVVDSVSQNVDSLVVAARAEIGVSSEIFNDVLVKTMVLLLVAGLLITLIGVWVSYHVVERQIGRRMSKLTSAVLDIAGGNNERVVAIDGDDEIGLMANALEVFKDNARKLHDTSVEMEQFAYAAAHDLRSPLRAIESLALWSLEDGEDLPEECVDNLKMILQRTRRLSTLQRELLEYSRAGHDKDNLEVVDLASMVHELSDLLDPEEHYAIQTVGHLPTVYTYVTPLRQVLLNLLTNAIKHHDGDHGKIKVRVLRSGERMTLSVQDDGAGIEPRFQKQIFALFHTLQSQDVVEGSGLGLALILKLVTRYGGQVQVESNPDVARGATFSFDWPAPHAAQEEHANSVPFGGQFNKEHVKEPTSYRSTSRYPKELPSSSTDEKNHEQIDVTRRKAS